MTISVKEFREILSKLEDVKGQLDNNLDELDKAKDSLDKAIDRVEKAKESIVKDYEELDSLCCDLEVEIDAHEDKLGELTTS